MHLFRQHQHTVGQGVGLDFIRGHRSSSNCVRHLCVSIIPQPRPCIRFTTSAAALGSQSESLKPVSMRSRTRPTAYGHIVTPPGLLSTEFALHIEHGIVYNEGETARASHSCNQAVEQIFVAVFASVIYTITRSCHAEYTQPMYVHYTS